MNAPRYWSLSTVRLYVAAAVEARRQARRTKDWFTKRRLEDDARWQMNTARQMKDELR